MVVAFRSHNLQLPVTRDAYLENAGGLPPDQRKGRFVEEIVEALLIDLAVAVIGIVFGRLLKKVGVLPS